MKKQYFHAPEQKEETKHGEPYFPVQKYITRLSEEYPAVTTHWHEEAELTLIVKGKCHYQVDLVDYEVKEGDLLFVPPLFLHRYMFDALSGSNYEPGIRNALSDYRETFGLCFT